MLAVKHSIPSHIHALDTPTELEALCVQIGYNDSVTLCLVYIPLKMYIQSLCDYINAAVSHSDLTNYLGISIFLQLTGIYFRVRLLRM